MITPDVIRRHEVGDHLTDEEMLELIEVYQRVQNDCLKLGNRFYLAMKEAANRLYDLKASARFRGILK
jgi:hypothetical protein